MAAKPPDVIISFDMETDLGNWWTTYEGVTAGTPRLLEILARHGRPGNLSVHRGRSPGLSAGSEMGTGRRP